MVTLDDPNPSDSPEMVMSYYSNFYPELTTATVHGPVIKNDTAVYESRPPSERKDNGYMKKNSKDKNHVYHWTDTGWNSWQGSSSDRPGGMYGTGRTGKNGLRLQAGP